MLTLRERLSAMSFKQEIENALVQESAELMNVISLCTFLMNSSIFDVHPSFALEFFQAARLSLDSAEELHVALLSRAGASWDVMSSMAGGVKGKNVVSRQALHRRLGSRSESSFQAAQSSSAASIASIKNHYVSQLPKPGEQLKRCKAKAKEIMIAKSVPQWWVEEE
jgi:hypothetical protein